MWPKNPLNSQQTLRLNNIVHARNVSVSRFVFN